MIATTEWMKENFDKFNAEFFNNELPNTVVLETSRRLQRKWGRAISKYHGKYLKIELNTKFDMTENTAKSILIHEMIHINDFVKHGGFCDHENEGHGHFFNKECARINKLSNNEYVLQRFVSDEEINTSKSAEINTIYVFKAKTQTGEIQFSWTKASSLEKALEKYMSNTYGRKIMSINEYKTNSPKIVNCVRLYKTDSRAELNKKYDLHRTVKYRLVNNSWTITERNEKTIEKYAA